MPILANAKLFRFIFSDFSVIILLTVIYVFFQLCILYFEQL
jgi:hypothetical protein